MKAFKKWSEKEIENLKFDYLNYIPEKEMEFKYKRNWLTIQSKANELKYFRKRQPPLNLEFDRINLNKNEIIELYKQKVNIQKISKIFNCYPHTIKKLFKLNNIKSISLSESHRKYTINENYFDVIDSEDKAYFLGFLYADGCNSPKKGEVRLSLQEQDKEILEKLSDCIGSNKPLRFRKDAGSYKNGKSQYALTLENKHICNQLIKLGCMEAKTYILQFPTEEQVPSYLHNHFIRGYFDGDGCISVRKTNTKHIAAFSLEGNETFITNVQKILAKNCFLNLTKMYYRHPEKKTSISLKYYGRKQVKKICLYLYKNANIYLDRKFQKFQLINY